MINDAIGLVESGTASVEDIDKAMRLGANHPMGPLALGDFIGPGHLFGHYEHPVRRDRRF